MGFFRRFQKPEGQKGADTPAKGQGSAATDSAAPAERESAVSGTSATAPAQGAIAAKPTAPAALSASAAPAASTAPVASTQPKQVKEISAEELKARMDAGNAPLLLDVREPWEHQIVNIDPALLMPMNTVPVQMKALDKNAEIVVYCHHGQRSWNVANYLLQQGFTNVKNLTGGIDSWARRVDKTKRTY